MMQAELFSPVNPAGSRVSGELPDGLTVVPNFISAAEEREIVAFIDSAASSNWISDLSRRVQHYGFRYDYKARALSQNDRVESAPELVSAVGERMVRAGYFEYLPDQVIVNEYEPGQGISQHIDRETCFGPTVASLSTGSDAVMEFRGPDGASGQVLLHPRSLIVLTGEARYRWKHGISARKVDKIGATHVQRSRRVSLTFRTVIIHD